MRNNHWMRSLAICIAICVGSSSLSRGEDNGTLLITIKAVLDDPKTEVWIESDAGKLEKLDAKKAGVALAKNQHYVTDLTLKDSKLVKIVFKKRGKSDEASKKP